MKENCLNDNKYEIWNIYAFIDLDEGNIKTVCFCLPFVTFYSSFNEHGNIKLLQQSVIDASGNDIIPTQGLGYILLLEWTGRVLYLRQETTVVFENYVDLYLCSCYFCMYITKLVKIQRNSIYFGS